MPERFRRFVLPREARLRLRREWLARGEDRLDEALANASADIVAFHDWIESTELSPEGKIRASFWFMAAVGVAEVMPNA